MSARGDFLNYALSLMRSHNDEHSDVLPVLDVCSLKHVAYVFQALIYWIKAMNQQTTLDTPQLERKRYRSRLQKRNHLIRWKCYKGSLYPLLFIMLKFMSCSTSAMCSNTMLIYVPSWTTFPMILKVILWASWKTECKAPEVCGVFLHPCCVHRKSQHSLARTKGHFLVWSPNHEIANLSFYLHEFWKHVIYT